MEEQSRQRHWLVRKKKEIMVVALLVLIPVAVVRIANWYYWFQLELHPELDPTYEPSHNMTVWIQPDDEEFFLHLDFYGSEDDLYAKENRYCGYSIRVAPLDEERNDCHLYTIPENSLHVWVKIYFTDEIGDPFIVQRIEIGQRITTQLLGREISILIEPYH
ncbi:MAG: hypothetical protein ACFFEV_00090 [Candidatus Thorarchaeota archaeon]